MRVRVIAADSMGVRSLATVVEACGEVIGIDLGASLGPTRYGLPPHPLELEALDRLRARALEWLERSSIVVITHYHYDHYLRDHPEAYAGKTLLVKHPEKDINASQRRRAWVFLKKNRVEEQARVIYADSQTHSVGGELKIEFSPPVWHGEPGTKVGKVLMLRITCGDQTLVFTSDTQGPADPEAIKILSQWKRPRPQLVIAGGPPTYFAGYKVPHTAVKAGLEGLMKLLETLKPKTLIVDHHLLRDQKYEEKISQHKEKAKKQGTNLLTAAEYMGKTPTPLEAQRKLLWKNNPP